MRKTVLDAARVVVALAAVGVSTLDHATSADAFCIVATAAFGCVDARDAVEMTRDRSDFDELRREIAANTHSGACRMFDEGETVFAGLGQGTLRAVRRPGDELSYWMPATWARPAGECAVYSSSRSAARRLGMAALAAPTVPEPPVTATAEPFVPRNRPVCEVKPVMTDAEISSCRAAALGRTSRANGV